MNEGVILHIFYIHLIVLYSLINAVLLTRRGKSSTRKDYGASPASPRDGPQGAGEGSDLSLSPCLSCSLLMFLSRFAQHVCLESSSSVQIYAILSFITLLHTLLNRPTLNSARLSSWRTHGENSISMILMPLRKLRFLTVILDHLRSWLLLAR